MGNFPERDPEFFCFTGVWSWCYCACTAAVFQSLLLSPKRPEGQLWLGRSSKNIGCQDFCSSKAEAFRIYSERLSVAAAKVLASREYWVLKIVQWIQCSLVSSVDKVRWRFLREQSCNHCCGICTCKNLHLNLLPKCHACKGGWLMRLADGQYVLWGGGWAQLEDTIACPFRSSGQVVVPSFWCEPPAEFLLSSGSFCRAKWGRWCVCFGVPPPLQSECEK